MSSSLILKYLKLGVIPIYFWWQFINWPPPSFAISPTLSPQPSLIPTIPAGIKIYLSELHPKPSSGEEWIEIYNPNSISVNLAGWQLWDKLSNPSLIYAFNTDQISAQSYLVVSINRKLNDTEDGVILKNAQGQVIDETNYLNSPTDLSWSLSGTGPEATNWSFQVSSPESANPLSAATSTLSPTSPPNPSETLALTPVITPSPTQPKTQTPISLPPSSNRQTLNSAQKNQSLKPKIAPKPKAAPTQSTGVIATSSTILSLNPTPNTKSSSQKFPIQSGFNAIIISWILINLIGGPILISLFNLKKTLND